MPWRRKWAHIHRVWEKRCHFYFDVTFSKIGHRTHLSSLRKQHVWMTSKGRHRYVSLSNIQERASGKCIPKNMIRLQTGCSAMQIEVLGNITNCLSWVSAAVLTTISWNKCAKICRRRKQDEAIASSCLILATPLTVWCRTAAIN